MAFSDLNENKIILLSDDNYVIYCNTYDLSLILLYLGYLMPVILSDSSHNCKPIF